MRFFVVFFFSLIILPVSIAQAQAVNIKPFDPAYRLYLDHTRTEYNGNMAVHYFTATLSTEFVPPLEGRLSDLVITTTVWGHS
jgi:hypothetical protein